MTLAMPPGVRSHRRDVLEANVALIRKDLDELKTDFRAAVIRLDNDIKAAVSELRAEIRAVAAKALRWF
jgi:hypothetical protein